MTQYTESGACTIKWEADQFDNVRLTNSKGHTFTAKSEGLHDFISYEDDGVTEPLMFHGGLPKQTKSGKSVWVTHCCELTKRYHGLYLNRDGVWIATSWDENGMWQKFDSSMDIKL